MIEHIKQHLIQYNQKNGIGTSNDELLETLFDAPIKHKVIDFATQWWTEYFIVTKIDNMLIGYIRSFDYIDTPTGKYPRKFHEDTICEMEEQEKTIKIYVKKY
jgi:hypothetical protein